MAEVRAATQRRIDGPASQVAALLANYSETRPKLLTEHFSEYEVRAGGQGAGTRVHWKLQATKRRSRDVEADVSEPDDNELRETDRNSSMVTTWTVHADSEDRCTVSVVTTWQGAGGIGGFFERTFAPAGLQRIYDGMLDNLNRLVG